MNQIRELTGTEITIEEDGTVFVTGKSPGAEEAVRLIHEITREYKAGERFDGVVTRIMDFGAFVKIGADTGITGMKEAEGLVHVSEIAPFRIGNVHDAFKEGEKVPVIIKEIDEMHRINLSIKQADPEWAARKGLVAGDAPAPGDRPFGDRPPRRDFGGGERHGGHGGFPRR